MKVLNVTGRMVEEEGHSDPSCSNLGGIFMLSGPPPSSVRSFFSDPPPEEAVP